MTRLSHRFGLFAVMAALSVGPIQVGSSPVRAAEGVVILTNAYPGVSFNRPVFAVQPPDGTPRMFVIEQDGEIWIVDHPAPATPAVAGKRLFIDLSPVVGDKGNEEGLLGFAFHPDYAVNGRFFVHYTAEYESAAQRRHVVAELNVDPADPDLADPTSRRPILSISQPYENHWGGWIGFGPDGMLYIALGDGGAGGDPGNRAQDLSSLLGKILRIDVDAEGDYGVPADNPFVNRPAARPEIFAYGLRNPWRGSFDPLTGDLWAGDVGQDAWEEVDRIVSGGNYGWRIREGTHDFRPDDPAPADPLIDPVAEYFHHEGRSITGGFVYRGTGIPFLTGSYLFADFTSGRFWALEDPYGAATRSLLIDTTQGFASFAEDREGEPYLLAFSGTIFAIRDGAPPPPEEGLPPLLSSLQLEDGNALPYKVQVQLWSDGAAKERQIHLPAGEAMEWRDEDAFALPEGTLAVKTFTRKGVRLETRVIRHNGDGFDAAAYRWRGDLSDADRVDERTTLPGGTWTIPGPEDCRTCHTGSAGFILGVTARQLGKRTVSRWTRKGVLEGASDPKGVLRNTKLSGGGRVEAKARSYLDANCAYCHRPGEPANGSIDLRATTPLEDTGILDVLPQRGDLGIVNARIVAPGDPARSTLLKRVQMTGEGRMPQLGTDLPDPAAARAIERWIKRL